MAISKLLICLIVQIFSFEYSYCLSFILLVKFTRHTPLEDSIARSLILQIQKII